MFGLYDINAHYGLLDIWQGEYETYLSNVDYTIVIDSLVIEGTKWNYAIGKQRGFEAMYLVKVPHI